MSVDPWMTLGINTVGNISALQMCLTAVLGARVLPKIINIRWAGEIPNFDSFYLEQLSAVARLRGVIFTITRATTRGVRYARDWQLHQCHSPRLWILDDDVIPDYDCLYQLCRGASHLDSIGVRWGWIGAVKVDATNLRGYEDYSLIPRERKFPFSQNHFYSKCPQEDISSGLGGLSTLDGGNALLNLTLIDEEGCTFSDPPIKGNPGGEDETFALLCQSVGLIGYLAFNAQSIHLEKEKVNFGEREARKALVDFAKQVIQQKGVIKNGKRSDDELSAPEERG